MRNFFFRQAGLLLGLASLALGPVQSQTVTKTYEADNANFANPERGFAISYDVEWPSNGAPWAFCQDNTDPATYTYTAWTAPLLEADLRAYRQQNITLVMMRYHIAEFRYQALSPAFIDRLNQDFAAARQVGIKVIPLFVYNWPKGGPDAPIDIVLSHLEALRAVFAQNVDVVASMDLGFVGCWGEWHHSAFGLVDEGGLNSKSRQIIEKVADVLPASRMFNMRYSGYKAQYFGGSWDEPVAPVTATEAFGGSLKSRMGEHDDCLICGEFNWGTYSNNRTASDKIKNFLEVDNQYVVQGGEPGGMDNTSTVDSDGDGFSGNQYADCARIVPLLNRLHWSTMNWNYGGRTGANALAYTTWENQGCTEEIQKRLGYRFRLTQAVLPTTLQAGGTLQASFDVRNDGFATPYNPRGLELIVRNKATLATAAIIPLCDGRSKPSNPAYDPRFWQSGKTTTLAVSTTLPATLAAGDYEVLVHLFDPLLYGRPEFSIRLANQNMWEATTGYNKLGNTLTITGTGTTPTPAPGTGTGLAGAYYNTRDLSGAAALNRTEAVDFDWGTGAPTPAVNTDNFSARWSGQVLAPVTGSYTFATLSDDGVRLWVNGQALVDNWTDHGPTTDTGTLALVAGQKYDVRLEYYENGGGATMRLQWAYPGQARQAVPQAQLFPAAVPVPTTPTPVPAPTASYYRLKNRWQNIFLFDNGDRASYAATASGDAFLWSVETAGGFSQIKNKATGDYLNLDPGQDYVACVPTPADWWSKDWTLEDAGSGFKRLRNRWKADQWVHVENLRGYAQHGTVGADWWSAQWTLEATTATAAARSASPAAASPAPSETAAALSLYPNPSPDGKATVQLRAARAQSATVSVRDSQGGLVGVFTVPMPAGTTDWRLPSTLPRGIYFVQATLDGKPQRFTLSVE